MEGNGERDERDREEREESAQRRIERKRHEAADDERDSADGPGYTARPTDHEPEEGGGTRRD
jgi:hypothetical protein